MAGLRMDGTPRPKRAKKLKPLPMQVAVIFKDGYDAGIGRRPVDTNAMVYTNAAYRAGFECGKKVGTDKQAANRELDVFARSIGHSWID